MRYLVCFAFVLSLSSMGSSAGLPRSAPEAQGVDSTAITAFVDAAAKQIDSLNSFMLVRHGQVVAEAWWAPYSADSPHELYSLSKSFTSTAIGIAIGEGKLSINDEVLKFFPEEAPAETSANLKSMRVSDLLRMNTGHDKEPPRGGTESWVKTFLAQPVPFKPGTRFLYNTPATYMLSAILQKVTGQTTLDYLKPRLFEPLGIENPTWEKSPQGVTVGGYGLSIRTEDIAKFGQLYLQKGKWQGKQLVPEDWVLAATSLQTSNGSNPKSDWDQGYGYQFWRCRHSAYRGDGAFGQYCIVIPNQDAVIAITGGLKNMQAVMDLVWDVLAPGLKASALPANDEGGERLEKRLKSLSLRLPQESGAAANVFGKTYILAENDRKIESIALENGKEGEVTLVARIDGQDQRIVCGKNHWQKGRTLLPPRGELPVATAGAWTADNTFTAALCFYETPFAVTWRLKFQKSEVVLEIEANVGFGAQKPVRLGGALKEP